MTCKHCNALINEGEGFCANCGAKAEILPTAKATTAMVLSIVGLALSVTPGAWFIGFIIALIAKSKIKGFVRDNGYLDGQGKTAKILSTIAVILGIISIVSAVATILYFVVVYGGLGLLMMLEGTGYYY